MGRHRDVLKKLERDFFIARVESMGKARSLGHKPKWILDSFTEGAIHCPNCNLWGRVVFMGGRAKERQDIGGRVLTVACSKDAVHTSESEFKWDFGIDYNGLSSIFGGIGYEPRISGREDFLPHRLKFKQQQPTIWKGRKR